MADIDALRTVTSGSYPASPVGLLDRHRVAILANLRLLREDGLAANNLHEAFMEIRTILVVLGLRESADGLA
jgi:hypothetical protein